eukprot:902411-Pelagomonas_calceolata.AAC.1
MGSSLQQKKVVDPEQQHIICIVAWLRNGCESVQTVGVLCTQGCTQGMRREAHSILHRVVKQRLTVRCTIYGSV